MRACTGVPIGRRLSRRKFIPKGDGQRPLGVASLEDKIVQRTVVEVFNAISRSLLPAAWTDLKASKEL